MRRFLFALTLATALLTGLPLHGEETVKLMPFSYHEDFETKDPVTFWVCNGDYEVNAKELTEEHAASGRKSLKLDVTLTKSTYCYWSVPLRVPCAGELKFSGRIRVETVEGGRVGLGCNYAFPPTHHSGCGAFDTFSKPTGEWRLQESDLIEGGNGRADGVLRQYTSDVIGENVVTYVDRWGIFIYGREGTRVVVYVDDVRLEGEVPEERAFDAEAERRFAPAREAFRKRLTDWRAELGKARREVEALGALPPLAERMKAVAMKAADEAEAALSKFEKADYAAPWDITQLESHVKTVRYATPNIADMSKPGVADRPFVTYVTKPITNAKVLPTSFPIVGRIASELSLTACRGEYEPASFAVSALRDVKKLLVAASDLESGKNTIPAGALDVRVVKCWYQAGVSISDVRQRLLVPELLLKDDSLIRVDTEQKHNYLRTPVPGGEEYVLISGKDSENLKDIEPRDAAVLQPLDLPTDTTRQFWVTAHVPDDAAPGEYVGKLTLTAEGIAPSAMTLRLRVLPFDLARPALRYSIYYRGKLTADGKGSISSEGKSSEQYEAEMRDLKAHGVDYPTIYQGYDEKLLPQALEIRRRAGLATEALYTLGLTTGNPTSEADLERLREGVARWKAIAKQFGYDELYVYGIDEAKGERLKSQRAAWQAVREAGAKAFVACYKGTFEVMGDVLDLAVYAHVPVAEEAEKYHGAGRQIFCYANPQVGVEEPETYRRNFGLLLWKAGYDGAMDYAYQHSFAHGWNDFDSTRYRDHNFTYQTVDGVLDTTAWEGFREGIDDVRYVTTLQKVREEAKAAKPALAAEAQRWLDELEVNGDLGELRAKMVEWILRLRE